MLLEVGQQSEENGQWQLKHLRNRRHTILGQGHTQVLFDGIDEHVICSEHLASVLQNGQKQLKWQDLWPQFMRPAIKVSTSESMTSLFPSWIPWDLSFFYILFHKKRLQTMLWHHSARVNSHQRWKQTWFRVCFHLWCELTSTMNVTEWQASWNSWDVFIIN